MKEHDVIIIGGGQSALACGYYLRRTGLDYLILDNQNSCGGAWNHAWDSLTLFSPAAHSSLPGWMMPKSKNEFPSRKEVIFYICEYEKRYELPFQRPIEILDVTRDGGMFELKTSGGTYRSKAIISATGTFGKPFYPDVPGRKKYKGKQFHSSEYRNADGLQGSKVLVVGEGNSGAQILAEVSKVAKTKWATRQIPKFLPDDVDGRVLFDAASAKYYAERKGEPFDASQYNLGNIVMVPPVKEARERDVLHSEGSFSEMYQDGVIWENGKHEVFDIIIWCTGFGFSTDHLKNLVEIDERNIIKTKETRAAQVSGLWLVGYGGWTGFASATLIGVGRSARQTVKEIFQFINKQL